MLVYNNVLSMLVGRVQLGLNVLLFYPSPTGLIKVNKVYSNNLSPLSSFLATFFKFIIPPWGGGHKIIVCTSHSSNKKP